MAAKYQLITELYRRTGRDITRNPQAWQGFLSSACRNYKCRFDEQLLIYAQRPDATAVAEIGTWNRLFKRWVNKDSKGIAVFDPKGRRNTLKYYFDVSDTHEGYYGSRAVPIWQMDKRYEQPVMERLADRFGGTEGGDLANFLMQTAENADFLTIQLTDRHGRGHRKRNPLVSRPEQHVKVQTVMVMDRSRIIFPQLPKLRTRHVSTRIHEKG